jgi:tRNA(Ile2) C34 agmatinyltransferase TiaS
MTVYCAIDDTDNRESRGTGFLARKIASVIGQKYPVYGVTRHQLFLHEDIPMTAHNSCAVIHIENGTSHIREDVYAIARNIVRDEMAKGSDPGLCVAELHEVHDGIAQFGITAKHAVVNQGQARSLADKAGIILEGLGGTEEGVIGALAGVGLAARQNDGRFVQKGALRNLFGTRTVEELLTSGVDRVITAENNLVEEGTISLQKFPRPAFIDGEAVLIVEPSGDGYIDLKVG